MSNNDLWEQQCRADEAREAQRIEAQRIAAGLCVITREVFCLTHQVTADFDHYLDTRPKSHNGHNPATGIAYND